eukprot:gb/GEZN01000750.1/.p1 GENE.gb/GEZN01000750.1/~~gb/GEZN01000750.1/.p1  ORF type:complete len:1236 (-),score=247.72 gb/GEZN01000750.1/:47-3661(-)
MTPEFRRSLFKLTAKDLGLDVEESKPDSEGSGSGRKTRRIPLELQALFAQLSLRQQSAVSTRSLTDSFGSSFNSQQQHDVSELNRILIDAIQRSLQRTGGQDLVPKVFRGEITHQTTCLRCGKVSSRLEPFYDLTLTVEGHPGLDSSIRALLAAESLEGSNQYMCSECKKKQDATKRARLSQLPQVLTLCLNRYRYDWQRGTREKVTSLFEFPTSFDMADYSDMLGPTSENGAEVEDLSQQLARMNLRSSKKDKIGSTQLSNASSESKKDKRGSTERSAASCESTVYDLLSVIIHRGSASSGHYHAYIRDLQGEGGWLPQKADTNAGDSRRTNRDTNSSSSSKEKYGAVQWNWDDESANHPAIKVLRELLLAEKDQKATVENLASLFQGNVGQTWKRAYRPKEGTLSNFVKRYQGIFRLQGATVSLEPSAVRRPKQQTNPPLDKDEEEKAEAEASEQDEVAEEEEVTSSELPPHPPPHWFDFDDERVRPVAESVLASQFGGKGTKETAYMLFFRRRTMAGMALAAQNGSPSNAYLPWPGSVDLPSHIREAIEKEKQEEQEAALRQAKEINTCGFHLTVLKSGPARRTMRMEFLRTERFKSFKAAIHAQTNIPSKYQRIHLRQKQGKKQTLVEWQDKDLDRTLQQLGLAHECELLVEDTRTHADSPGEKNKGAPSSEEKTDRTNKLGEKPIKKEQREGSLAEQEMARRQGSRQVKVLLRDYQEGGEQSGEVQVVVYVPNSCTVRELRHAIQEEVAMPCVLASNESGVGRLLSTNHRLHADEALTLQQANISDGHNVVFEPKPLPSEEQFWLRFQLVQDGKPVQEVGMRDLLVKQTVSIKQCKELAAAAFARPAAGLLLRLSNAQNKAGSVLHEEEIVLLELRLEHGALLHLETEPLRPEGEISLQLVFCSQANPATTCVEHTEGDSKELPICPFRVQESSLSDLGSLVLQDSETLFQLKQKILSFPLLAEQPSPNSLRLSEMAPGNQPGRILRNNQAAIGTFKLKNNTLFVEVLAAPEEVKEKSTLLWLTERKVVTDSKEEHAVLSCSNTPCLAAHVNLNNVTDLPSLKRLLTPYFPLLNQSNMSVAIYNQYLYTWKELADEGQSSRRKKSKRKKKKKVAWSGLSLLRDRAVVAVKIRSSDPKRKDKWQTSFDKYMVKHDFHPLYNLPPRPSRGGPGGKSNAVSDHAVLSIDVDDFDDSSEQESD